MKTQKQSGKFFYGWLVVAGCFVIMGMSYGAINNCMGIFIKPVCDDMGFSRAGMGVTQSLLSASLMVMSLVSGRVLSRIDITKTMRVCAARSWPAAIFASPLPKTCPCSTWLPW